MSKKRCILSFVDNKNYLILEMYYIFESFLESKLYENSDLIICGPIEISSFVPSHPSVIYLPTESISNNCDSSLCKIFKDYHFINSMSCVYFHKNWLLNKNYEYMLRTDTDVFLTPNFKDFFPDITQLYTGKGGYSNDEIKERLKSIAQRENIRYQGVTNIGSTWYGSAKLLIEIAELTVKSNAMLIEKEFAKDHGEWPNFCKGVSLLYASELAINHLVDKDNIIISDKFDAHSDSNKLWKETGVYHIHCWHGSKMYCKFANTSGKYLNYDENKLDYNKTNEYCLLLSLRHKDKLLLLIPDALKNSQKNSQNNKKRCPNLFFILIVLIVLYIMIIIGF